MRGCLPVYKRELKTYFQSPSTYVVMALFFMLASLIFQGTLISYKDMTEMAARRGNYDGLPNITLQGMADLFNLLGALFLFTIPLLSMRLIAEEKSRGTFELLATCPVTDWGVLTGKFFALVSVGAVMIALSAVYPLTVLWVGRATGVAPEWPVVISAWIGLVLVFATYSAFGLMASALSDNQISAAVITLIGLLVWLLMSEIPLPGMPAVTAALAEASAMPHIKSFTTGVLSFSDALFFVLSTFMFLFIAAQALEARRWRT